MSLIFFAVIIRTVEIFALFMSLAFLCFVNIRMICQFFPAMSSLTKQSITTSVYVIIDCVLLVPMFTNLWSVIVLMWFTSVVLPVVSKYAQISFMSLLVVWAPNGLKMEQVKVVIPVESIN